MNICVFANDLFRVLMRLSDCRFFCASCAPWFAPRVLVYENTHRAGCAPLKLAEQRARRPQRSGQTAACLTLYRRPPLENLPLLPPPAPRDLTQQPNIFSSCVNVCLVVEKGAPSTLLQGAQRQQQARKTDIYCSAVAALLACQVTTPQGRGNRAG
jgi:hypothetical protein